MQPYKDFDKIVQDDLNEKASLEERMLLWDNKENLLKWKKILETMLKNSVQELKNKEEVYEQKLRTYSKNTKRVLAGEVKPEDPNYLRREELLFEEYQENHDRFKREVGNYWRKIKEKIVFIEERLVLLEEEYTLALQEHLDTEKQILLLCLEDRERVDRALLQNWHVALSRGIFLGASYMYRLSMQGSDTIEAWAEVQAFFKQDLAYWREHPEAPMPVFEAFIKNENDSQ